LVNWNLFWDINQQFDATSIAHGGTVGPPSDRWDKEALEGVAPGGVTELLGGLQ